MTYNYGSALFCQPKEILSLTRFKYPVYIYILPDQITGHLKLIVIPRRNFGNEFPHPISCGSGILFRKQNGHIHLAQ
jgi:hypothetical protein